MIPDFIEDLYNDSDLSDNYANKDSNSSESDGEVLEFKDDSKRKT